MVWPASPEADRNPRTGVDPEVLRRIGRASVAVPNDFVNPFLPHMMVVLLTWFVQELHPRLQRHIKSRLDSLKGGTKIDWATAEVH
jgi:probable 2-oxoglutarate dehydrogenase E1 component DHKTD1